VNVKAVSTDCWTYLWQAIPPKNCPVSTAEVVDDVQGAKSDRRRPCPPITVWRQRRRCGAVSTTQQGQWRRPSAAGDRLPRHGEIGSEEGRGQSNRSLLLTALVGSMQRFREPVHPEGAIVSWIWRASGVFNARVAQDVDTGSCEQSGVCQSVAGIAVAEKNRCLRISAPGAWSVAVLHHLQGWQGQFQGQSRGKLGGRVSPDLVYT
jgi:hypothetical protein